MRLPPGSILALALSGCVHFRPDSTGAVREVDFGRVSTHLSFENVSSPSEDDPTYRYRLQAYGLKRVGYEEEIEPQIRMTTAGWIIAGAAWATALGTGAYFQAEGIRKADSGLKTIGSSTLFVSDAILLGTLGFRFLAHGRKLKARWNFIDASERNVVDAVRPVPATPVELLLKTPSGEKRVRLSTGPDGVVEVPLPDLQPQLARNALTPAKLMLPGNKSAYTTFSIAPTLSAGPTLTLIKPNQEFSQVDEEVIELSGMVRDRARIKSLQVALNGGKVLAYAPKSNQREYTFNTAIQLDPGLNVVRVRAAGGTGSVEKIIHVERRTQPPQTHAVFIGISKYASLPSVGFATEDARSLRDMVIQQRLVGSANVSVITDEEATLERVRDLLGTELKQRTTPNDDVLVYFAGHGATEKDLSSPDGDGFSKYLAVHDTKPGSLYSTALPIEEIRTLFERIRAKNVLFILDTCYSGSGGRTISQATGELSDKFLSRLAGNKGRAVMSSAGPLEVAREDPKLKHGIYTWAFLQALEGKADANDDGLLTIQEIQEWVFTAVNERTNGRQNPTLKGRLDFSFKIER